MSAPDTNVETQKKRHYGPIWGIAVVMVIVGVWILAVSAVTEEVSEDASTITPDQVETSQRRIKLATR